MNQLWINKLRGWLSSRFSREARIRKKASQWIIEIEDGTTREREDTFEKWRSEDFRHEAIVQELQRTWLRLGQLNSLSDGSRSRACPDVPEPGSVHSYSRRHLGLLLTAGSAAAIVLLGSLLFLLRPPGNSGDAGVVVQTGAFDYSRVQLDDGSIMELNANSRVHVDFRDDLRLVELARGEAHFKVRKDALRPFLVEVDEVVVEAVGTAFNIRLTGDSLEILVTEGRVAVDKIAEKRGSPGTPDRGPVPASGHFLSELSEGQELAMERGKDVDFPAVKTLREQEIKQVLAWKGPRLFFDSTPISEAVRQFNQTNQLRIQIEDPEIGALRIGGSFLTSDVEAFLRLLEMNRLIQVDRISKDQAIIRRGRPLL